jgi:hypothetical protein
VFLCQFHNTWMTSHILRLFDVSPTVHHSIELFH